jgi:dipeptidyl aminopeptidase/acylaminoacyl peptidase
MEQPPTNGVLLRTERIDISASAMNMARRSLDDVTFKRFGAVQLFHVWYRSDGLAIHGYLALPPWESTPLPALIFNRGGTGHKGLLSEAAAMNILCLYAAWGYVVVASNYRGVGKSEGSVESWGHLDVVDSLSLLPLLQSLDYVDVERVGLIGGSRGGMIALQMLARTTRFKAAVTFGAPTSIHTESTTAYIRKTMTSLLNDGADAQHEATVRSAVTFASQLCKSTPLLVLHGTGDKRVPPEHSLLLAHELQRNLHPYKLIMYDNADHVLAGRRNEANADIRWWVDAYVRDGAPLPRVGPHGA